MKSSFALDNGLDLRQVVTTGSVLHINEVYDDIDDAQQCNKIEKINNKNSDINGKPVKSFADLELSLKPIDENGYVKKKVIEEGGGYPLKEDSTVSVSFSGFWENDLEPFDFRKVHKPLVVDLKDSGLLPGLEIAIKSMLVGEMSIFLLSHQVMYGEMGIPPRIKPKATCVFYIKLQKCINTPKHGEINFSEPIMFRRVLHEAKLLYGSGVTLHKTKNFSAAIQLFRKAVFMLHKCRLADEEEEKMQEKLLVKLYLNLAVGNIKIKQPLKACVACNELKRLGTYWNNGKVLYLNAKALRMIGQFDIAERRLKKALKLCPAKEEIKEELHLLQRDMESCNKSKLLAKRVLDNRIDSVTDGFKNEVDNLVKNFKENNDLCKLVMPTGLIASEVAYIKEVCIKENLFYNKIKRNAAFDSDEENITNNNAECQVEGTGHSELENYALDKYDLTEWDADLEALADRDCDEFI